MANEKFIDEVLNAFRNIQKEIESGSSEFDIRYRFVKYFLEKVLGHGKNIRWEKKRADLTIFDENNFCIIKIETKKPEIDIDKKQWEEQAFSYIEPTTKYVILTNFLHIKQWEIKNGKKGIKIDLEFDRILRYKRLEEELTSSEKSQILFFSNLTKKSIFDPKKYEEFIEGYAKIDITKEQGFKKLLERLNYIVHNLLLGYTLKAFGEYKEGYNKYLFELKRIENNPIKKDIAKKKKKLEQEYERFLTFSGFYSWKEYSGKENIPDDKVIEIFCKETIYVLLNKLLFIRICEDKGLLPKNISNGGIVELRKRTINEESVYKEIMDWAFKIAGNLYSHFYEIGVLDWYRTGDSELNAILNRVLWILNQFDFTHVDRDILGNLYEQYLPGEERKRLGEFYTPVPIIDYILSSIGYTYSNEIENKDLLDPCCGSGGFLVRATRGLISKYLMKFGKTTKKELRKPKNWKKLVKRLSVEEAKIILESIQEHIYGLDINPFACHIAEMNILFQVIDLYQKIREKEKNYKLKSFKIFRTNSLEFPKKEHIWDFAHNDFFREQEQIDEIKIKKFDFVVANPPYVRKERISKSEKKYLSEKYPLIHHGDNDYYVYFLYKGIKWLKENGKFGYIVSSKFTKTRYGKYIRAFILENSHISKFVDLRGSKVFAHVTVDPCILILDRTKSNRIRVVKVKKDFEGKSYEKNLEDLIWHIFRHGIKDYTDNYIDSFEVDQISFVNSIKQENGKKYVSGQNFLSKEEQSILNKIRRISNFKLKDISEINCGIKTGKDKVFIIDNKIIEKFRLEKSILKPILDGKDIRKYEISYKGNYLIFTENINLSDFPNIKNYLEQFKEDLKNRTDIKNTNKKWYELRPCKYYGSLELEKIITPDISTNNNFAYDKGDYFIKNTAYFIKLSKPDVETKFILGLLNSKLLEFEFKQISVFLGKMGYRYTKQHLDKLSILLPKNQFQKDIQRKIIEKVNKILDLKKKIKPIDMIELTGNVKTEKLHKSTSVTFSISDKARFSELRTEKNKVYVNLIDFIEIRNKILLDFVKLFLQQMKNELKKSENIKEIIYNLPIPESKNDIQKISNQIRKSNKNKALIEKIKILERGIDESVYQLYGINNQEKKIIENSLKI